MCNIAASAIGEVRFFLFSRNSHFLGEKAGFTFTIESIVHRRPLFVAFDTSLIK